MSEEKEATYLITYDVAAKTAHRRKFYRHLKKLLEKLGVQRCGDSVIAASDFDDAKEIFALVTTYAFRCVLFKGEILIEKDVQK